MGVAPGGPGLKVGSWRAATAVTRPLHFGEVAGRESSPSRTLKEPYLLGNPTLLKWFRREKMGFMAPGVVVVLLLLLLPLPPLPQRERV